LEVVVLKEYFMQVIKLADATLVIHPKFLQGLDAGSYVMSKDMVDLICQSGGALASWVEKDQLENSGVAAFERMESGYFINIYEDFFVEHSKEERMAILEHEVAHVKFGHLPKSSGGLKVILDMLGNELEADAYAGEKFGKRVMANALTKTVKSSIDAMALVMGLNPLAGLLGDVFNAKEQLQNVMGSEPITTRLKALA
jgi:hypothetical protein